MSGRIRSDVTTQRILEVYNECGCNAQETGRRLNLPATTVKDRLRKLIGKESLPNKTELAKQVAFAQKFNAKLRAAGIDPDLVNLDRMVIKEWEMGYKDADDIGQKLPLEGVTFYASPTFETGPLWTPIHSADGILVEHVDLPPVERRSGEKVAIIKTDPQIGYLMDFEIDSDDFEEVRAHLTPFHDEAAIDVAKQLVREIRPDRVIHGGDTIDFPEHTRKFRRHPQYFRTTQPAVQRAHRYIAEDIEAAGPQCEQDICPGNHDERLSNDTLDNQMASHGLRAASVPGERPNDTWPVNSVPNLLRLDYLQSQGHVVRYRAPYPSGRIWLNDYIVFRHDYSVKVSERSATVLHGHDHKLHVTWTKVYLRGQEAQIAMVGCGSLCRNDLMLHDKIRTMPSYVPSGKFEQNWQQGIVVVYYDENGGPNDFDVQPIRIQDGVARYNGKKFEARCDVEGRKR